MELAHQIPSFLNGKWQTLPYKSSQPQNNPFPRINHSAIHHKNNLYIYGGQSLDPRHPFINDHRSLYKYNLNPKQRQKQWHRIQTSAFPGIHSHCCIVYANIMYLFGGKLVTITNEGDQQQVYITEMWGMNLDSYNWRRQEQKGMVPGKRESASMVLHKRTHILLYGGRYHDHIYNDIHIYKIEGKMWFQVDESYQSMLPMSFRPAICSVGEHIYIFGGERYETTATTVNTIFLKDFHQISIIYKSTSIKPDVWVKKIVTSLEPGERSGHSLVCSDKHLLLVGGSNFHALVGRPEVDMWLYSIEDVKWMPLKNQSAFSQRVYLNCFCVGDLFYFFGGFQPSNDGKRLLPAQSWGIETLSLQLRSLQTSTSMFPITKCKMCKQDQMQLANKPINNYTLFYRFLQGMHYPFSAIGLLIDNSIMLKASNINLTFNHTPKHKYLLIQDNGDATILWKRMHEFVTDLLVFRILQDGEKEDDEHSGEENEHEEKEQKECSFLQDQHKEEGTKREKELEKEIKKRKEKAKKDFKKAEKNRKEYSTNIKLGTFRLGKVLLMVWAHEKSEKRKFTKVCLIESTPDQSFQCYYYELDGNELTKNSSQTHRAYIESNYKKYLRIANDSKDMTNFLFIIDLRQIQPKKDTFQPQLRQHPKTNNIHIGNKQLLTQLSKSHYQIQQCLDISLRGYLSWLYLKRQKDYQNLHIFLAVGNCKLEEVVSSTQHLEKLDKIREEDNRIYQMDQLFNFKECNILEIYCSDSKKQLNTFFNGILIYHRNRLVKRFFYDLGDLVIKERAKIETGRQLVSMFGFIELKGYHQLNLLKTKFIHDQVLDKINNRIHFVEEYKNDIRRNNGSSERGIGQQKKRRGGEGKEGKEGNDGKEGKEEKEEKEERDGNGGKEWKQNQVIEID